MATLLGQTSVPVQSAGRKVQRQLTRGNNAAWTRKTVSNGTRTTAMLVWSPFGNKKYETFSYLPALNDGEISRQVDYITRNGWVPCLEFSDAEQAYVNSDMCDRMGSVSSNYFDNRYWTMWKLPMFGCSDPGQVLSEVQNCRKAFPTAYSRLVAFDPIRQVQICSFVVNHPEMAKNKASYGAEVSNGISGSSSTAASSSSYSAAWNTSSTKTNDWTYTWDKTEDASTNSWDTGKKDDWTYDWNKKEEPAAAASSWDSSSSWNSGSSSSASSYSSGEDLELKRTMEEVQRKLAALKATVNDVIDKVDAPASNGSYSSSWNREEAVSSLERSYGSSGSDTVRADKKDSAWYNW